MLKLEYKDYTLEFKFNAGTSRGVLKKHPVIILKIYHQDFPAVYGLGEAAPLEMLSPETFEETEQEVQRLSKSIRAFDMPALQEVPGMVTALVSDDFPSLKFALETALYDLLHGGKRIIYKNEFYRGERMIPINGLIWMGKREFMQDQIDEKLREGYRCIKMKIGAIDFTEELKLLEYLRGRSDRLVIRVDANGAFKNNEAFRKLGELKPFGIHSIEQPIMARQWEAMQLICQRSPVPVALDEELIGIHGTSEKRELLDFLRPKFLVLKPTLLGGFAATEEWIALAQQRNIEWWITSALESNIGLNAISQFTARFDEISYQGLGTGKLYTNNFDSPLEIRKDFLQSAPEGKWGFYELF